MHPLVHFCLGTRQCHCFQYYSNNFMLLNVVSQIINYSIQSASWVMCKVSFNELNAFYNYQRVPALHYSASILQWVFLLLSAWVLWHHFWCHSIPVSGFVYHLTHPLTTLSVFLYVFQILEIAVGGRFQRNLMSNSAIHRWPIPYYHSHYTPAGAFLSGHSPVSLFPVLFQ